MFGFATSFATHLSPTVLMGAGLLLRFGLAAVWLLSSTGKLWDLPGTRQALTDFGVPPRYVRAGAIGLPVLELLVAWGLLVDVTSRWAGGFSALLALAFTGGLVNLLRQNRRPPCHCFGSLHSAPVGKSTVFRALALALVCACYSQLPVAKMTPGLLGFAFVSLGLASAVSGLSNWILWKRLYQRPRRTTLQLGQRIPAVKLRSDSWLEQSLDPKRRNLLVFMSKTCGACNQVREWLPRAKKTVAPDLHLQIIDIGPADQAVAEDADAGLDSTAFGAFRLGTPSAVWLDSSGVILDNPVEGGEQLEALLRVVLRS